MSFGFGIFFCLAACSSDHFIFGVIENTPGVILNRDFVRANSQYYRLSDSPGKASVNIRDVEEYKMSVTPLSELPTQRADSKCLSLFFVANIADAQALIRLTDRYWVGELAAPWLMPEIRAQIATMPGNPAAKAAYGFIDEVGSVIADPFDRRRIYRHGSGKQDADRLDLAR